MTIFKKEIFSKAISIFLLIIIPLLYFAIPLTGSEDSNGFCSEITGSNKHTKKAERFFASENSGHTCDLEAGICGPPPGW